MIKEIYSLAIDGGPSSGKSTILASLIEFFGGLGYPTVSVPEAASELLLNGVMPLSFASPLLFQEYLMEKILLNEEFFGRVLHSMNNPLCKEHGLKFCDRGLLSGKPYVGPGEYEFLLKSKNISTEEALHRYKAVMHMRTAPEEFYTVANNIARTETYAEACVLDKGSLEAWQGHPNIQIIGNDYGSFEGKVNTAIGAVSQLLGVPKPLTIERKWRVRNINLAQIPNPVVVRIVQHYLLKDEGRVRAWIRDGSTTYFHTHKSDVPSTKRVKVERIISRAKYEQLLRKVNMECAPIEKWRAYFTYKNQYFRLDSFHHDIDQILEVQPSSEQEEIIIPPFIKTVSEVTDDSKYYNYNIARELAKQRRLIL